MTDSKQSGNILRKEGNRVVVSSHIGRDFSYDERCQCVVGQNSIHPLKDCHVGSPNRKRCDIIQAKIYSWSFFRIISFILPRHIECCNFWNIQCISFPVLGWVIDIGD